MPSNQEKFKELLRELFMFDAAELDFGIYRIMNAKRTEIEAFLDNDLLPTVQQELQALATGDRPALEAKLTETIQKLRDDGFDPEQSKTVKELREKLAVAVDVTALENEIFSDLYNFFRRYYNEGDFLSLRRYKKDTYAIPYEGEEVKLYWANHDQYYIKTSEYFRDYTFKLEENRRVHFKVVDADTELNNNQSQNGEERRFILTTTDSVTIEGDELTVRFEYRSDPEKTKQTELNKRALEAVQASLTAEHLFWSRDLAKKAPTGKNTERTLLEKHLTEYTARNTFDYFIHKDLDGFLQRELDFFLKNEIMHLDDIENESAPKVEQYLTKLKSIRKLAHQIITLLAQIEGFQKRLWLKKKFVVATDYCITLDRVLETLYAEIAANTEQRMEWVRLFAIDEIKGDLAHKGYSEPLTVEFLKQNPYLVLDTKFYDKEFKTKLLASIDDLDEQCDGLMIQSENFQALNLLNVRYREQVKCIYIDPPYNTDAEPISYKNGYPNSSWLSLMEGRLWDARAFLDTSSIVCVTIDDIEIHRLRALCEIIFPEFNLLGVAPIKNNPAGRTATVGFSICHEYALFYGHFEEGRVNRLEHSESQKARYKEKDELGWFEWTNFRKHGGINTYRSARPRQFYPIYVKENIIRIPKMTWDEIKRDYIVHDRPDTTEEVLLPIDSNGNERIWDFVVHTAISNLPHLLVKKDSQGQTAIYRKWRINEEGLLPQTWWDKPQYSAAEYGTNLLAKYFGSAHKFMFPKSIHAVEDCLRVSGLKNETQGIALDFFAGSGTTGHAVINLNREDDGNRKYILVEMGEYFDTVLKPRIQKVIYSKDWKDGKPVSRAGSSHCFKYLKLESYEDTLNNLAFTPRTTAQEQLLLANQDVRREYLLSYFLEFETKESASLLSLDRFTNPFDYELKIATGTAGETKATKIDLVETFNYLIGLRVKHIDTIRGFRIITGTLPNGEKTLILWRILSGVEPEVANDALEKFFQVQGYNTRDQEYDTIFVNGDNTLENLRKPDQTWKVRLIEEEFLRRMFDTKDGKGL